MTDDEYAILNTHSWEAGMLHVHPEDLNAGAYRGVKVECSRCEDVHPSKRACPHASAVTLELWGFDPEAVKATLNCGVCGGDAIDCASGCLYDD